MQSLILGITYGISFFENCPSKTFFFLNHVVIRMQNPPWSIKMPVSYLNDLVRTWKFKISLVKDSEVLDHISPVHPVEMFLLYQLLKRKRNESHLNRIGCVWLPAQYRPRAESEAAFANQIFVELLRLQAKYLKRFCLFWVLLACLESTSWNVPSH